METKKILGVVLIALGLVGLIPGVLAIFEGGEVFGMNPWAMAILGFVLFIPGIGLMKTVKGSAEA